MKKSSLPSLIKKATKIFNLYIRLKYADKRTGLCQCVTCCAFKPFNQIDAGHYIKSTYFHTRFDERNVHPQCVRCNRYLNGNESSYALFLIRKYGAEILEALDVKKNFSPPSSFEKRTTCEQIIQKYSQLVKMYGNF